MDQASILLIKRFNKFVMRKMFLCTLVVIGFMNFSFSQLSINSERISVKMYDAEGLFDQFQLRGNDAAKFDIPEFIKENEDLERVIISGSTRTDLLTTTISFDSYKQQSQEGDYVCKEETNKLTPFLGVYGTGRRDFTGVDIKRIIPSTSADRAGMNAKEIIREFNGTAINDFADLKREVLGSEIGERVELTLENDTNPYSLPVIVGSRGTKTIVYKYCREEQEQISLENNFNLEIEENALNAFPNPTNSVSHLNFTSGSKEDVIFTVTDIAGNLIHKKVYANFEGNLNLEYNLKNQSSGTYILSILQGKEMLSQKVQLIKD